MSIGPIPPALSDFTQQLEQAASIPCELRIIDPSIFLIRPLQQQVFIVFYKLTPYKRHWIPAGNGGADKVIHLDEDLWITKGKQILDRLAALLGKGRKIFARQTIVARISKGMAMEFQQEYHLHVPLPGKYRYGLFLNGELVSVAVFSGGRRMQGRPETYRSFELLRFCHKGSLLVVGGLSKLLAEFGKDFHPGDVMTYVDREWSDGKAYEPIGFVPGADTGPQRFWVYQQTFQRFSAYDLPAGILALTETERINKGYYPLDNLGSLKMLCYKFGLS